MSDVESRIREFYDEFGWQQSGGKSGEDTSFRQFSPQYYPYHERVNERTMQCFTGLCGNLLIAGGGDLPETHTKIAERFSSICCVDISQKSLDLSKQKLGERSEYVNASILDIPKSDSCFDSAYCAHVIYHIARELQSKAVRELIRVLRPGGKGVIIYSNPDSLAERILRRRSKLPLVWRLKPKEDQRSPQAHEGRHIYFFAHDLGWWNQFQDTCDVDFVPWNVLSASQERQLFIRGASAWCVYRLSSWYERKNPRRAVQLWSYPVITLTKKATLS